MVPCTPLQAGADRRPRRRRSSALGALALRPGGLSLLVVELAARPSSASASARVLPVTTVVDPERGRAASARHRDRRDELLPLARRRHHRRGLRRHRAGRRRPSTAAPSRTWAPSPRSRASTSAASSARTFAAAVLGLIAGLGSSCCDGGSAPLRAAAPGTRLRRRRSAAPSSARGRARHSRRWCRAARGRVALSRRPRRGRRGDRHVEAAPVACRPAVVTFSPLGPAASLSGRNTSRGAVVVARDGFLAARTRLRSGRPRRSRVALPPLGKPPPRPTLTSSVVRSDGRGRATAFSAPRSPPGRRFVADDRKATRRPYREIAGW